MNDLDALRDQAGSLLRQSPPPGLPPAAVAVTVNMLLEIAAQRESLHYFLLRDRSGGWGAFESDAIGSGGQDHLPSGRWLPAFARRDEAIALQERRQRGNAILLDRSEQLELAKVEVMRVLWVGLGLTQATGLMFLEADCLDDDRLHLSSRIAIFTSKELKRRLAMALRRYQSPPVA